MDKSNSQVNTQNIHKEIKNAIAEQLEIAKQKEFDMNGDV